MRTTLAPDDDILSHARSHAQRERVALGEVVSRLARQGIVAPSQVATTPAEPTSRYALLPARGETITTGHVRASMDQEGLQLVRHRLDVDVRVALLDEAPRVGHDRITDLHPPALAVPHGGCLVTMDHRVSTTTIVGATERDPPLQSGRSHRLGVVRATDRPDVPINACTSASTPIGFVT